MLIEFNTTWLSSTFLAVLFINSSLCLDYRSSAKKKDCSKCKREVSGDEYAAIIDGGSSGSRIRLYRWTPLRPGSERALPDFREINNTRVSPGVSDYADRQGELLEYFKKLIDSVLGYIPKDVRSKTNLYFMATAGMRLLLEDKANDMIASIDKLLADPSIHPLRYLSPDNSRILSGEEEGVFAWISVNYLKNTFSQKNVRAKKTFGILELGGASTQIAFAPSGNILADKFPVLIAGVNYQLYVHSYLYYGQNYVDQWLKNSLYRNHTVENKTGDVSNPCMIKDDKQTKVMKDYSEVTKDLNVTFAGTGSHVMCREVLNDFVYRIHESWKCNPKPCAIGTVYQPTIKNDMEFVAIGAFVHSFNSLKVLSDSGVFDYFKTEEAVIRFCNLSKEQVIQEYSPDGDVYTSVPCLMGTYSPMMFVRGYGFRNDTRQISVKANIDGKNADWTLGAIIYEYEKNPHECDCKCSISSSSPSAVINTSASLLLAFLSSYLF